MMATPLPIADLMRQASELQRMGRLGDAERVVRVVLNAAPDFVPALQLLGVLAAQGGNLRAAHDLLLRAVELDPASATGQADLATVLNLLGLRFSNRFFEPVWNRENVERIEIIADEKLALEGRSGYYDHAGALKDMIQSHLLLVMALLCMEAPNRIEARELRDLQAHVLRATRLWDDDPVAASRRARYVAGTLDDREIPDYVNEPGVDAARGTETLAEVTVEIRNARWHGVPIRLRSGKALGDGFRGIIGVFKPAWQPLGFHNLGDPNVVVIGMADEVLQLKLNTNGAMDKLDLEETVLTADLGMSPVRPYGEILAHIMDGDPLLSVRNDVAEDCWRILGPVLDAWRDDAVPLDSYRAGSTGPTTWS